MQEIEISIIKYESIFTTRTKDLVGLKWFSFPNDLLLHPDFFRVNGEELKWFLWCVSICTKCKSNTIRLNIQHACSTLSLNEKYLFSMIEKLKGKQIDTEARPQHDREPTASRPRHDRGTTASRPQHDRYNTLHNNTLHNNTLQTEEVDLFFDFWNSQEKLPKAIKLSKSRKDKIKTRLKEADIDEWKKVISLVNMTEFLTGRNDRGWKADIDWLIANEENRIKVVEGKYKSNPAKSHSATKASQIFDTARDQIERIEKGEL